MRCKRCKRCFRATQPGPISDHHWNKQECFKCHFLGLTIHFDRDHTKYWSHVRGGRNYVHPPHIENVAVVEKNFPLYSKIRKIIIGKTPKNKMAITNWRNQILLRNENITLP